MYLLEEEFIGFKKAATILRAINHPLRRKLYEHLSEGESNVTDLYVKFRLEQSVCSQHLAILRKAGWVTTRREGKSILYRVNDDSTKKYADAALQLVKP